MVLIIEVRRMSSSMVVILFSFIDQNHNMLWFAKILYNFFVSLMAI